MKHCVKHYIRVFNCIKSMEKTAKRCIDNGFVITELSISQFPCMQSYVTLKRDKTVLHYMVGAPLIINDR